MIGLASRDLTSGDVWLATACTVAVFLGAGFALRHSRLEHHAALPEIDPGSAIPIAVRPVADFAPAGKKGAGREQKQARKRTRRSAATTTDDEPEVAEDTPPLEAVPAAWQRKLRDPIHPSTSPDAESASPTEDADPSVDPPEPTPLPPVDSDAAAESDASTPEGEGESTDGTGGGGGEVEGGGLGEGGAEGDAEGADPLLERAIAFYRARLVAWFASRFRVTGSGLSPEQLGKYRVRARIEIGDDLQIVSYRILSSDHPAFHKAATATLDALRGEKLPPPPENYPGAVQRLLTVSFTCSEDACD